MAEVSVLTSASGVASSDRGWVRSPVFDTAWILAPPLVATLGAAIWALRPAAVSGLSPVGWLVLVVGVDVAHVYAALFRTYLRPQFPEPLRPLLWVVPLAAWSLGALLYYGSPLWFWRALAYLAVFHFVRQPYGLLRLYGRAQPLSPLERGWDAATIYSVTLLPLLEWHVRGDRQFHWFVDGDFFALPGDVAIWATILRGARALGVILLTGFVLKECVRPWRGQPLAWGKLGVVLGTAAAWWVGVVFFNSDSVFTATNVISHGVPYAALVWAVSQRDRVAPSATGLQRWVLLPAAWPLFIALLVALAFSEEALWDAWIWRDHGAVFGWAWNWLGGPVAHPLVRVLVVPLLAVPQATHYALDAWIWKSRWTRPAARPLT